MLLRTKMFFITTLLLDSALVSLGAALVAQYKFDLQPCVLCIYQRFPYAAVIVLMVIALFLQKKPKIVLALWGLCSALFLVDSAIAFYHSGVEHKIFAGPDTCSGATTAKTLEEMRAELIGKPPVRCDSPAFVFLGLSMAEWNMLWSLLLAFASGIFMLKVKREINAAIN